MKRLLSKADRNRMAADREADLAESACIDDREAREILAEIEILRDASNPAYWDGQKGQVTR